jgi:DNA-binding NarL/FixJ family response regulator
MPEEMLASQLAFAARDKNREEDRMAIEPTIAVAGRGLQSRCPSGDTGIRNTRRRHMKGPADHHIDAQSAAHAEPTGGVQRETGPVRVGFETPDPITEAGMISTLRSYAAIEILPNNDDGKADVLVVVADQLTYMHTARLRQMAAEGDTPVVLICDKSVGVDLMTIAACRIVVILPRPAATPERILSSVLTAADGGALLNPAMLREILREAETLYRNTTVTRPGLPTLTRREAEALRMTADGLNTAEIAQRLKYSERTVKSILQGITHRLAARNRPQAVAFGIRSGLI